MAKVATEPKKYAEMSRQELEQELAMLKAEYRKYQGMELNLKPTVLSKDPIEINGSLVIVIPIFINQQSLDWVISLG